MGIKEINNGIRNNSSSNAAIDRAFDSSKSTLIVRKAGNSHKNIKQVFILSFDALKDRKARSALTILMVVVGSGLMVALNGMSAGQSKFLNKQLNFLAPNILFVSSGQRGFRGGPQGPPTIIINNEVVNRIKSLPFVQEAVPSYQGQLEMNARGNILNVQVMALNPQKIYLVTPSLQLVDGSTIQANNPS